MGLTKEKKLKTDEVTPAAAVDLPPTDITVDDMMARDDAVLRLASRRKRYPDVAAQYLGRTLKKNRTMLKELQVSLPEQQGLGEGLARVEVNPDNGTKEVSARVAENLACCKQLVVTNGEKTGSMVDALGVLD